MTHIYSKQRARAAVFHTLMLRPPGQIATVIGYVLLVRLLSEAEYGIYNLFYALLPLLAAGASFGLEHTLRRYQPEYLKTGRHALADLLVRRIGVLRLISTAAALALLYVFWPKLAPIFKIEDYRSLFLLFAVLALTHFQCSILTVALSSHLLQKHSMGMQAVAAILKTAGYAIVGYGFGLSLWSVFWIDLGAYVVLYVGLKYYYVTYAERRRGEQMSLSRSERWRLFKYGFFYNFNDAGTLPLQTRTDNFFIVAFLDPVAVGAYSLATRLSVMVYRVTPLKFLESVVRPLFFSLDHQQNAERVKAYFTLLVNASLLVMIPIAFFVASFHHSLVEVVFAGKFLEYSPLLTIVFLFAAANAIDVPVTLVAQLKEKAHVILLSRIFGLYNIAGLLLLIPMLGIAGAMLASGSAVLLKNLFIWWFVRDIAVWQDGPRFLSRTLLVWVPYAGVAALVKLLDAPPLGELALGVLLWAAFFAAYLRFWALAPAQRALIAALFPGRETRLLRVFGFVH